MIIYLSKLILILVFNIGVNIYYINSGCQCCCCGNGKSGEIGSGSKGNLGHKPQISTKPIKNIKTKPGNHIGEKRSGGNGNLSTNQPKVKTTKVVNPNPNNYPNPLISANPSKDTNQQKVKTTKVVKHKPNNDHNSLNTAHVSKEVEAGDNKIEIDLDNSEFKCNGNKLQGFKKIDNSVTNNVERVINGNFKNYRNIYYTIDEVIFNSIKEYSNVEIIKKSNSDTYIVFAVKTQVKGFSKENPEYDYYLVYCYDGNTQNDWSLVFGLFKEINTNVEIKILCSGNNLTDISYMFFYCINLEKIIFTIKGLNTSNVTNMKGMFRDCEKLEKLNLSNFDTSNVTDMSGMFNGCSLLKELNLNNFNTLNVTSMRYMFNGCNKLIGNVTTGDTRIGSYYGKFIKMLINNKKH